MTTALEILKKAREVIVERGDVARNGEYRDPTFTPPRVCSIGAIRVAVGNPEDGVYVSFMRGDPARQASMADAVDVLHSAIGRQRDIDVWNDGTQSVDQVLAAFDRAIATLEEEE